MLNGTCERGNDMDGDIIELIKNKDTKGLDMLICRYKKYVWSVLCGIGQYRLSQEDLEELCADVFFSVWKNGSGIKPCASLKPYLAKAARNAVWGRLRKKGFEPVQYDDGILTVSGGPCEEAEKNEMEQALNSAVGALEEPGREIFVRHYFYGEAVKAISQELSMNESTVKTKLFRIRKSLKAALEGRGFTSCEKANENQ